MRMSEQIAVVADDSCGAFFSTAVNTDKFSNDVSIPNSGVGHGVRYVFSVLRLNTDGDKWENIAIFTDGGVSLNHDMGSQPTILTNLDVGADGTEWAYA